MALLIIDTVDLRKKEKNTQLYLLNSKVTCRIPRQKMDKNVKQQNKIKQYEVSSIHRIPHPIRVEYFFQLPMEHSLRSNLSWARKHSSIFFLKMMSYSTYFLTTLESI